VITRQCPRLPAIVSGIIPLEKKFAAYFRNIAQKVKRNLMSNLNVLTYKYLCYKDQVKPMLLKLSGSQSSKHSGITPLSLTVVYSIYTRILLLASEIPKIYF
jgi:hypothetical protein